MFLNIFIYQSFVFHIIYNGFNFFACKMSFNKTTITFIWQDFILSLRDKIALFFLLFSSSKSPHCSSFMNARILYQFLYILFMFHVFSSLPFLQAPLNLSLLFHRLYYDFIRSPTCFLKETQDPVFLRSVKYSLNFKWLLSLFLGKKDKIYANICVSQSVFTLMGKKWNMQCV